MAHGEGRGGVGIAPELVQRVRTVEEKGWVEEKLSGTGLQEADYPIIHSQSCSNRIYPLGASKSGILFSSGCLRSPKLYAHCATY